MAEFVPVSLTKYGAQRIIDAHVGVKMLFTSIGFAESLLNTESLYYVSQLINEKQRFPISEHIADGDTFSASCHVTTVSPPAGIYLRSMGLYIADPAFENNREKDRLFAVTSVIPDASGNDYIIYLPQTSSSTLLDHTFTMHTKISPSAEIIIKQPDGGSGGSFFQVASETVLGGLISSPAPGKISVNEHGEATANELDRALNFIDSYTPYSLPVADENTLGGLKASITEGHLSIDPETQEGLVNGYEGLKALVTEITGAGFLTETQGANLMSQFTEIRDSLIAAFNNLSDSTSASVSDINNSIDSLSSSLSNLADFANNLSEDTSSSLTDLNNLVNSFSSSLSNLADFANNLSEDTSSSLTELNNLVNSLSSDLSSSLEGISASITDLYNLINSISSNLSNLVEGINDGSTLPQASLDQAGIVQLSSVIFQNEELAATPKAIDDLRQSLEGNIAELTAKLESLEEQASGNSLSVILEGDDETLVYPVTHNFGTRNIKHEIYDYDTGETVGVLFRRVDLNTAQVQLGVPFDVNKKFVLLIQAVGEVDNAGE